MLPISPSAEAANSESGSTPSRPQSTRLLAGEKTSSINPGTSPETGRTTAIACSSGAPSASTASASGRARATGTARSIETPVIDESALAAVPEPMFAISRRASSSSSEKLVVDMRVPPWWGSGRVGEGVAVDDQGDLAARQDGGSADCAGAVEGGRKRAGDELALAHERVDLEDDPALAAAGDDGVAGDGLAGGAERVGEREQRQDAVAL